jgi:RNA polymerase sigma-70 factor (ECF subfamily)
LRGERRDCTITPVGPPRQTDEEQAGTATLGDLLYADKTRTRVAEKDWLRLVESVAGGDQLALRELFERTNRVVFTLIMRITNDHETAEELTLDVFHDVWRRASRYDASAGTVVGWIMNQARSRAIDRLRFERRKKRVNSSMDESQLDETARRADATSPGSDEVMQLRNALTILTPDERAAIETAFFGELTYAEVATRLDQPLGTIKTRIRTGLAKLRQTLGAQER